MAADVFVLTSGPEAREGLPMSLLEAAACRLPVVVTRGAGLDRMVSAAGGFLSEPDAGSLARALADAATSRRAGLAARAWAETHDKATWLARHQEVFADAVARSSMRTVGGGRWG